MNPKILMCGQRNIDIRSHPNNRSARHGHGPLRTCPVYTIRSQSSAELMIKVCEGSFRDPRPRACAKYGPALSALSTFTMNPCRLDSMKLRAPKTQSDCQPDAHIPVPVIHGYTVWYTGLNTFGCNPLYISVEQAAFSPPSPCSITGFQPSKPRVPV